ncbi:binding-protein-dependent transport systems inner membrane component [Rippkaea orientalis PCC 8801]|uniref:Binding-protein-dependent transport systems inner membrane component n=1 Tax=Rippkaea orientalis (strain PCC 8801 / RF-1) TaxID=41431 RepID=B7K3X7_RIPO1|nr:ABC transporter permease [Rippkaea orientalis]ACK66517.1 binding-protein-dependent transport systems inner membrane component [Rippkaea orientalis PCC 8801]
MSPNSLILNNNPQNNLWSKAWRRFRRDRLALLGLTILTIIIVAILIGPILYRVPIDAIDFAQSSAPPSWQHPFGTNALGQDQLSRVLFGGRISLTVGIAAMGVAIFLGTAIGAIAGFYGGIIDSLLMRLTDLFLSLPQLPLLLLIVYLFRDTLKTVAGPELGIFILVVVVIGGLNWMSVARLVRGNVLKLREMEFMSAATALGASPRRLILIHLLPNVLSVIIVAATLAVGNGIITESTLSFLGLGFPPDVPTWGQMLFQAKDYLTSAPHMALFPGLAIFLTVLSINYLGDGLRDALDPKTYN